MPLFTACSKEDDDVTPPTISVKMNEVDVTGGKLMRIDASQLFIGEALVATWSDDKTAVCTAIVTVGGTAVQSGATINNAGTLMLTVTDAAGNKGQA